MIQTPEFLRNYGRINMNLWWKLDKLRQYHSLSLHDVNMAVSQELYDLSKATPEELKSKQGKQPNQKAPVLSNRGLLWFLSGIGTNPMGLCR